MARIPHPIPYQGSKRKLAPSILSYFPRDIETLFEPFAGSAAISIAAAREGLARYFHLNDLNAPLMNLWQMMINQPEKLIVQYERIWREQHSDPKAFYEQVRDRFNERERPQDLLFLLVRCVKGAVRYNANGQFNQSADNRRRGISPSSLAHHIRGVAKLFGGKTVCSSVDYKQVCNLAKPVDLIYMDPPYQGLNRGRDSRYFAGVTFEDFAGVLKDLNENEVSFIISYDGRTGDREHGMRLPSDLNLHHMELDAGRSTQATFHGRDLKTFESLYLSSALLARLRRELANGNGLRQTEFLELEASPQAVRRASGAVQKRH